MGLTLLLGAGFSRWAAELPVASELFDFKIETWSRESRKLELVKSLKKEWDEEHPEGFVEQFIADMMVFQDKRREAVIWYITRRLSAPFIQETHYTTKSRQIPMFGDSYLSRFPGIGKAKKFLHHFCLWPGLPSGIITFNYDLLVEAALGPRLFNYGVRFQSIKGVEGRVRERGLTRLFRLTGPTPLLKLHGSISWDNDGYCYADGRCGITGRALIVAPSPEKQPEQLLRFQWEMAEDVLARSTQLLVFGFAFNSYDEAALSLLRNAGKNIKSVLLIDIHPPIERLLNLLPGVAITPCQPPPSGNADIYAWQVRL